MSDKCSFDNYVAIRYVADMIPIGGRGTPVCPPTYMAGRNEPPAFARTEEHPVPDPDTGYTTYLRDDMGKTLLRPAVIIDSLGAEAGRIEAAIVAGQDALGVTLPGIFLDFSSFSDEELIKIAQKRLAKKVAPYTPETLAEAIRYDFETANASTWTTSHRHADTYIRHAVIDGKQIWEDPESEVYSYIANASQKRADILFRYFPNSALMGFWLASDAPRRHKLARSLSCTITGYDAHEVNYGSTKGDVLGGITSQFGVARDEKTMRLVEKARVTTSKSKAAPSEVGLGLVPSPPVTKAFSCGSILRRGSISLTQLRHLTVPGNPEASDLIADVLGWMGLYGIVMAAQDGFYRSGCNLVPSREKTSVVLIDRDGNEHEGPTKTDEIIEGFAAAYDRLPKDLRFADPIVAEYPTVIVEARAETLIAEATKKAADDKD